MRHPAHVKKSHTVDSIGNKSVTSPYAVSSSERKKSNFLPPVSTTFVSPGAENATRIIVARTPANSQLGLTDPLGQHTISFLKSLSLVVES